MSFAWPSEWRIESSTIVAPVELKCTLGGCYQINFCTRTRGRTGTFSWEVIVGGEWETRIVDERMRGVFPADLRCVVEPNPPDKSGSVVYMAYFNLVEQDPS